MRVGFGPYGPEFVAWDSPIGTDLSFNLPLQVNSTSTHAVGTGGPPPEGDNDLQWALLTALLATCVQILFPH